MSRMRFLQNTAGGDDPVEFVAFLVWYIFLVMCCLIPTCCAYRRRRIMERRLAEQQATMQQRLQHSNLLFLSNFANESGAPSLERVRTQLITDDLTSTTMLLESHHFVDATPVGVTTALVEDETRNDQKEDIESQMENSETEEHIGFIKLPKCAQADGDEGASEEQEQASRLVSDTCTICLCQYIEGESITWSTRPECVHAFHTQCIISWLAKQEQSPQCPVCRQEFCSRSLLPVVRQEDEFLRTIQQALLLTQMYGGRGHGRNVDLGDIQLITHGRRIPEEPPENPPSNIEDPLRRSRRSDSSDA